MSSAKTKKSLLFTGTVLVCAMLSLYFVNRQFVTSDPGAQSQQDHTPAPVITDPALPDSNKNQLGAQWDWNNFESLKNSKNNIDTSNSEHNVQFDVVAIFDALQAIELDQDGNVIPDPAALNSLQTLFDNSNFVWNETLLAEIQGLVMTGLPGTAGEQTVEVIGNYYEFFQAKQQINTLYNANSAYKHSREYYDELKALREMYLGQEVATRLFEKEDAEAEYMFAALALESDTALSAEQKQARQAELAARYLASTPDIPNWESRYAQYQREKQQILNSDLSDRDKQTQITQLAHQHFSAQEINTLPESTL